MQRKPSSHLSGQLSQLLQEARSSLPAQLTPLIELVQSYLRKKHLLLLLDNFEQVVTAAPLLTELLVACPALKILVTSRAVLRIHGEHEFPVPPLALPELKHLPDVDALLQYPAVALFFQRIQDVKPDFVLTRSNAATIAEIS